MSSQPLPKGEELIEKINKLTPQDWKNAILIKGLKNEAEALKRVDAFRAYRILGMLACIEGEVPDMHSNHVKAISLEPNNFYANYDYAVSLFNIGQFSEAIGYAEKVKDADPIIILEFLIESSGVAGHFKDSMKWISEWKKINPNKKHRVEDLTKQTISLMKENETSSEDVERLQKLAHSLLLENNMHITKKRIEVLEDEESRWLSYMILLDEPVSEIVDLNEELAERMAEENLPSNLTSNVVIMYSSAP